MGARYGQHFLINKGAINRIVDSLDPSIEDWVIEIGPGKGALTKELVKKAGHVTGIEVDSRMAEALQSTFTKDDPFTLLHNDFLNMDLNVLPKPNRSDFYYKVAGNLPYNLTSPILRKLSEWTGWITGCVMVQKEVGDRLCASVGEKVYGALTVGMNLTCEMEKVFDLEPGSFRPAPKVRSSVVLLRRRLIPLTEDIPRVQRVVQAAFQQRRKTILNSLSHGLKKEKEQVVPILDKLGIPPQARAETISIPQYVALGDAIIDKQYE